MIKGITSWIQLRVIAVLLLLLSSSIFAQKSYYDNYCTQGSQVIQLMEEHHVTPLEVNDDFSSKVFHSLLKTLDSYKLYFSEKDINELKKFEYTIDDELNSGNCKFLKKLIPLYKERLQFGDSLVKDFLSQPIDYTEKSELIFEAKSSSTYAKDDKALKRRWVKWMKYLTLESMAKSHFVKEQDAKLSKKNLLKYELESRTKISGKYTSHFEGFLENNEFYEDLIAEMYFLAITTTFDPHSMYLSPELEEYIIGSLSKEKESLGIEFEENELGDIIIARLVPGGPSWKSNQIHVGDLLLGIQWEGDSWMDLSFVPVEELENLLLVNSNPVTFKIQKPNGKTIEVPLIKELIRADENLIKSFILKSDKSIGYIALPGFYTEFESQNKLGCANDIAKAIIKMQKENIDGLIIDLRNNGGGSLKEAIELSGIFIDFGPLTIASVKNEKPTTIKDINRGSIYNSPLLIMVNGMSASASEMFSATMQDYNRAIIVGSPTFGKSTGQSIIPLNKDAKENKNHYLDLGFIKITNSIFYRLNRVSYQKVGVTPDIPLPYLPSGSSFRESDYPTALSTDSIVKKIYMPKIGTLPYQELLSNSKNRIASDSIFQKIVANNNLLESDNSDTLLVPLSIKEYVVYQNEGNSTKNSILGEIEERTTSNYEINEITYDSDVVKMDEYTKEINQVSINQLKKDIYLEEAFHIILDLIKIENK